MNIAQRLFLVAAALILAGGVVYAKTVLDVANAKSRLGLALTASDRFIAQQEIQIAQMQNDPVALERAREQLRVASMSADERFQTQRYLGYGLLGAGVLFGLVGFVVGGAKGAARIPNGVQTE
jgi:hypothetical protein